MDKGGHPVHVLGFRLHAGLGAGTGTGTGAGGSGLGLSPRGYGDGLSGGVKLEAAAGKLFIGFFILEEDNLAKGFKSILEHCWRKKSQPTISVENTFPSI